MLQKILSRLILPAVIMGLSLSVLGQSVKLTGKVINESNKGIPGVSIKIGTTGTGTTTDVDGNYSLSLTPGKKYEISFSAIGFDTKILDEVEVTNNQVNELNVVLKVAAKELEGIVVKTTRSSARLESVNSIIAFQKNTNTVASVISAETIRRSPDKNTGEVLKRIPGTSIQEGKYLVVRGLSDRYNLALLNGVPLTSTEPDRKTFSFDIFPSTIIDNIIVNKAFVPEFPGEWAGGLVQINTKDVPSKGFLNVQIGTGFNTQTLGKDFYTYKGGKLDWLGIDDGTRALPSSLPLKTSFSELDRAAKTEYGKLFENVWSTNKTSSNFFPLLNRKFELSGGFNKSVGKKSSLGATFAVTYNESNKRTTINNIRPIGSNSVYEDEKYSRDVLADALANVSLKIGANNKISLKNIINVNSTNYATERRGQDDAGFNVMATELALKSNTFFTTQLSGEHNISAINTKFHWYGSFNILDQYIPDQRRIQYNQDASNPNNPYVLLIGASGNSQQTGSRYYGFLSDYIYTTGGDLSYSWRMFGKNQTVKVGYLLQIKDRLFDSRPFAIYLPSDNPALTHLPASQVFAPENFGNGTDNKFAFNDLSGSQYRYLANTILNAVFLQFENEFSEKFKATWGLRVEDYDQLMGSVKQSDPRYSYTQVRDFLPGLNLTYKVTPKANLRLSGSQTVIRPEFRELSTFAFFDFDMFASITGDKTLERTKVTNADLRYEIYPRAGELFTLGVFYKYFEKPIELFFNQTGAGSSSTFNYINADKATGYGVEFEMRKKLDFIEGFQNFVLQSNLSYIYNRVTRDNASLDRPMQGQSPYVINFGLQYDIQKAGLNTTLLYNQVGDRIFYVGGNGIPPVFEKTRPLLDFQIAKKIIGDKGEIKLNISDIMNKRADYYYDNNNNSKYDKGTDDLTIRRKYGTTVNISFSYNIK
ncbi:MAG: TonB-dependent receptor [Terrimonas sp.]|nr:TonB-dependent receptor [Terrimonas sp.]